MTTQNRIIIVLLTLIVIIAVVWFVQDNQKAEKQYQACLEICEAEAPAGLSKYLDPSDYLVCKAECKEKYAK